MGGFIQPQLRVLRNYGKAQAHLDLPGMFVPFLSTRIRRPTGRLQLYLGCRWCPLVSIVSQCLGSDWPHKIDCQVWTSPGHRDIQVPKLSCYLGLGYCILRKVPRNVVGAILNICYYADVWISFIYFCIISDYPARVSKESSPLHLSKRDTIPELYSGNGIRPPSRSRLFSGSPILAPTFIVRLSLNLDNTIP